MNGGVAKTSKHGGHKKQGKPFVVPDRKQLAPGSQPASQKPKPAAGGNGRPFVVPERKPFSGQPVKPGLNAASSGSNNAGNNKLKPLPTRKAWWDHTPALTESDLIKFEEGQYWYTNLPAYLDELSSNDKAVHVYGDRLTTAQKAISAAYQQQLKLYNDWLKNSTVMKSDHKWMNDMIKSGTMSDKVAAMALKVQSSPFHELETLDTLMALALRKEQRAAQLAMEALKDLFVNNLLPDRPLRSIEANGWNHPNSTLNAALLQWFETQIKSRYDKLLEALDNGLKSNVDYFKRECLQMVSELLIAKPEQESRLLSMLTNKLGDPSRATCSKAIEVLKNVMRVHPAMKIVIVREVRQFLYRPNLKIRPIFNGIILLSQVQLASKADHAVAVQLVEGYLSLFEKTMKEEEYGSRLLSALLTGINKALPYLQTTDSLDKYVDPLFKIVHTATSFSTATQALMLLSHLALSHSSADSAVAGGGVDGGQAVGQEPAIVKRYYRALYAKLLSEQITTRSRNTLFLNLLYRSIKGDHMHHRAMAFVKRLLICAVQSVPPIAAGLLYLVSEIVKARPALKACLADVPESVHSTGAHADTSDAGSVSKAAADDSEVGMLGNFNVGKREPEFAYAAGATASVWELALLARHFHPSVQTFTKSLLEPPAHHIVFNGDPTVDFSVMAFLNRFAYKNPKKSALEKIKSTRTTQSAAEEPINLAMSHPDASADNVHPDQQFFFKYFSDKSKLVAAGRSRQRMKAHAADAEDDDSNSDGSDVDVDGEGSVASDASSADAAAGERKSARTARRGGQKGEESDPDEAEIDRFADKLAQDLMRSAGHNGGFEADDFDFSEDDDSDDGSAVNPDEMEPEEDSDDDEDGQNWDEGLEEGGESDNSDDAASGEDGPGSSRALDFADFVAEHAAKTAKNAKNSAKTKKGRKDEDDSSDDGYTGLVAYGDDDGPDAVALNGHSDSGGESLLGSEGDEDMDAGSDDGIGSGGDDTGDGDSDDDSAEPSDEQGSDGQGDSDSDFGSDEDGEEDFDSAEEEALESAGFMDSDSELPVHKTAKGKGKESGKLGAKKAKRGASADDVFASADDFEDVMEEIVQKVRRPAATTSATAPELETRAEKAAKPGKGANDKQAGKQVGKGAAGKPTTPATGNPSKDHGATKNKGKDQKNDQTKAVPTVTSATTTTTATGKRKEVSKDSTPATSTAATGAGKKKARK